ncbi:MAG: hypothetical protein IJO22_00940 [Oscillospiraceae bacterium]|nr:hypothetical protein [Oscillospiraceae bacterium]
MFKIISAIILSVLMIILCSCVPNEPEVPVIPEEETEKTELSGYEIFSLLDLLEYPEKLNSTPCGYEGGNPYKAPGVEVPVEIERTLFRIRRTGDFMVKKDIENEKALFAVLMALPMVNRYDLEPELAEKLGPVFDSVGCDCFYPMKWVKTAAREIFGEDFEISHESIESEGFIYHDGKGVYTPPGRSVESVFPYITKAERIDRGEGEANYEIEFFYISSENLSGVKLGDGEYYVSCNFESGENLFEKPEFIEFAESGKDLYKAKFYQNGEDFEILEVIKKHQEPELIAEHIAALNEATKETFGAKTDFWGSSVSFYFEEENTDWNTVPDAVNSSDKGLYYDFFERSCFEVSNFKTKAEVREYMSRWLDPSLFEKEASGIDFNFMEFDGKLYLMRGNRGYGVASYGNTEIISKSKTEMTAVSYIYYGEIDEVGTAEIKFEKRGENWIIVSVEDNYY